MERGLRILTYCFTFLTLVACAPGPQNTCTIIFAAERQVTGTHCGPNELLVGFLPPSTLYCALATASCPKD